MKKNKINSRLFIGPMSKEIVDSVIDYTNDTKNPLGLIPSRRQVENTGGYVNHWSTDKFCNYVGEKTHNVALVRDHGGPLQGEQEDDGKDSLSSDIDAGMEILHIDPWKASTTVQDGVYNSLKLIEFCLKKSENILFEVGTEEAIFPYSPKDLEYILTELQTALGSDFNRITHCVIQSGVKISGLQNVGNFDSLRLSEMVKVAHGSGLLSKEHNGDYLTEAEIRTRAKLGLDSINIAPEFGVTQTRLMLERFTIDELEKAHTVCKQAGKYIKWIPPHLSDNPPADLIIKTSGHYCFTSEPFKSYNDIVRTDLKKKLYERFDSILSCWALHE